MNRISVKDQHLEKLSDLVSPSKVLFSKAVLGT